MSDSKITKLVINDSDTSTVSEQITAMIKELEKQFKTGPIIGDSLEVIRELCRNIMVKDLILSGFNLSSDKVFTIYQTALSIMEEKDIRVLEARNKPTVKSEQKEDTAGCICIWKVCKKEKCSSYKLDSDRMPYCDRGIKI